MEVSSIFPDPLFYNCSDCSHGIYITTHLQCESIVCANCGACYDFKKLSLVKHNKKLTEKIKEAYIPLGSFGTIKSRKYKVVGVSEKKEGGGPYYWREYALFNPYYGYAFLSEYDGHWTFLEQLIVHPKEVKIKEDLAFDRQWFRFFNKYNPILISAYGEFCFKILDENDYQIKELISPPNFLSYETSADEQSWFSGEYIEPDNIQKIFGLNNPPPKRIGIGACQPMKLNFKYESLLNLSIVLILILIVLQVFFSINTREKVLFEKKVYIELESNGAIKPVVSDKFRVDDNSTNLEFNFYSPVRNSWMEFAVELINEETGKKYEFLNSLEFYSGYSGGEHWSEGKQNSSSRLSSIPAGTYHVNIWPVRENYQTSEYFDLIILEDVPMYSNMFVVAGVLLIFPIVTYSRRNRFERKRWMNSNYSPYDE